MTAARAWAAASLLLAAACGWAGDKPRHSYESCSLITSEYLTVLQLASRGLSADVLKQSLPDISSDATNRVEKLVRFAEENGIEEMHSTIHAEYARCAKSVFEQRGLPDEGTREAHFHYCAGENKVRYEIIMAAIIGADRQEVVGKVRPVHRGTAEAIYNMKESNSTEALFDNLASELKRCINQRP